MISLREEVEDAAIKLVSANLLKTKNASTGYLAFCGEYNGEVDQLEGPDDLIRRVRGRMPCVLIFCEGAMYTKRTISHVRFKRTLSIEVTIMSDHLRSREHRLRMDQTAKDDPSADPGIYRIIEDVQAILSGDNLGIHGAGYIRPIREDRLLQEKTFTAWRQEYTIEIDANVRKRDAREAGFITSQHLKSQLDGVGKDVSPNPLVESITN